MEDKDNAASLFIVKDNVRWNSPRATPVFKYCGATRPPQIYPASSPQKFFLKSITALKEGSIPNFAIAEVLSDGNAGLKVISPLFNIDNGTVTITLLARYSFPPLSLITTI